MNLELLKTHGKVKQNKKKGFKMLAYITMLKLIKFTLDIDHVFIHAL